MQAWYICMLSSCMDQREEREGGRRSSIWSMSSFLSFFFSPMHWGVDEWNVQISVEPKEERKTGSEFLLCVIVNMHFDLSLCQGTYFILHFHSFIYLVLLSLVRLWHLQRSVFIFRKCTHTHTHTCSRASIRNTVHQSVQSVSQWSYNNPLSRSIKYLVNTACVCVYLNVRLPREPGFYDNRVLRVCSRKRRARKREGVEMERGGWRK